MTELPEHDETARRESIVHEIHEDWKALRDRSSSGEKAWLTQMKNHYLKLIQADAEAAAEMLASQEYYSQIIRKHGLTVRKNDPTA